MSGKRFLPRNAPRLPLPECTKQDQCHCRYRHYGDRRADQRRASLERTLSPKTPVAKDRRRPGERRERGR